MQLSQTNKILKSDPVNLKFERFAIQKSHDPPSMENSVQNFNKKKIISKYNYFSFPFPLHVANRIIVCQPNESNLTQF